jgi:hypothetical protein
MTTTLALRTAASDNPVRKAGAMRPRLPVALACFVAAIVFATAGAASTPLASWMGEPAGAAALLPVQPASSGAAAAPVASAAEVRSRRQPSCASCGVVESVMWLEPVGDRPASYELTVRLRDGSSLTSRIADTAHWRAGDRIILIGGVQPAGL